MRTRSVGFSRNFVAGGTAERTKFELAVVLNPERFLDSAARRDGAQRLVTTAAEYSDALKRVL